MEMQRSVHTTESEKVDTQQSTLTALIENISDAIIFIDDAWCLSYMSDLAQKITGVDKTSALGRRFFDIFPESLGTVFEQTYRQVKQTGKTGKIEAPFGPHQVWYSVRVFPVNNNELCLVFSESTINRRLEVIASGQRNALSEALSGAPLEDVLAILADAVERQSSDGAIAVITLNGDNETLQSDVVAPKLPVSLAHWLREHELDADTTPCGLSAQLRKPVTVQNLALTDKWQDFTSRCIEQDLHALWCTPIFSTENKTVLGTFGVYYADPIQPNESDTQVIDALSRTAAIVIERIQQNQARLRAESALSENAEQLNRQRRLYETALSNTFDHLYIFDLDGRFTYANDALLTVWGMSWEEAIGKNCFELGYEPWQAEMHMREIRQVIATKQPIRGDVPFTGTHGRRIYDYILVPVIGNDGNVEAVAGSTRDVTERREAEEMAKQADARRRLALEASHSFGIWDWDVKNNVFTADERLGELFNLTPDEAEAGVPIETPRQSIHQEDVARVQQAISDSIERGVPYDQEFRIVQRDGSIRWGSFRGRVMFDKVGNALRFPGVGVDVTLERNAIDALQEADQRKDEFLATLAHELRNPLAPISNAVKIIQLDDFDRKQKDTAVNLVERHVQQMIRLVDDLMDVSRITRGKIRLDLAPVNVSQILEAAIETVQPLIEERQHALTITRLDDELWVSGDAIRLSQVFSNIINNAAKYTDNHGAITITLSEQSGDVCVAIADNGSGIPVSKLDNIFEMFSQVDVELERSQGGLGIGLTLVKRLIEMHQGSVTVESEGTAKGACFTVRLPQIAPPVQAGKAALLPEPESENSPIHVLIADDNQDAAISMGWLLEAKGCKVVVVEDGPSALEAVTAFTPDLVLLDIGMPGMNGYDLCIALRKNAQLEHALFVAQTGWGQPEHIRRSRESGFHHHLVKPLSLDDLMPLVDEVRVTKASGEMG